tara:strand:+ start:6294 stop:6440 length:147 start_codon:yes stop_codon:yes gene_type:complete
MSNHVKTPEEMHRLVTEAETASTTANKIAKILEWLAAATDDLYAEQDG